MFLKSTHNHGSIFKHPNISMYSPYCSLLGGADKGTLFDNQELI